MFGICNVLVYFDLSVYTDHFSSQFSGTLILGSFWGRGWLLNNFISTISLSCDIEDTRWLRKNHIYEKLTNIEVNLGNVAPRWEKNYSPVLVFLVIFTTCSINTSTRSKVKLIQNDFFRRNNPVLKSFLNLSPLIETNSKKLFENYSKNSVKFRKTGRSVRFFKFYKVLGCIIKIKRIGSSSITDCPFMVKPTKITWF